MSTAPELVVIVRDLGLGWVLSTAAAVRRAGCAVGLVSTPLTSGEAAQLDGMIDELAVVDDVTDTRRVADAAARLAARAPDRRLVTVFSPSDGTMVAAAIAAHELGVGRVPVRPLAVARNKYAARLALRAAGQPTPRFALLTGADEAAAVAADVGLPAVVKPVNGTGSHLVEPVRTVDELAAAYRKLASRLLKTPQLRHIYTGTLDATFDGAFDGTVDGTVDVRVDVRGGPDASGPIDPSRTFLVESMLCGAEYSVDVIVRDGHIEQLPIMHKFLLDSRFFELGFTCPPLDADAGLESRLRAAVAGAVSAIGLDNTLAHVEVIDDATAGPTVVEVNGGRPGGQVLGHLYQLNSGVNTVAEIVSLAMGRPSPRTAPALPIPLASLTLFAGQTGRLRAIHGLDELARLPDVIQVVPTVQPGDLLTSDHEIFAVNVVVAGFVDLTDLTDTYEQASGLVRFEVDRL